MNYFKNLSEEQNRLNLKSERVELEKLSTVRREMTNTIKKYNNTINDVTPSAFQFSSFVGDFSALEGKMEKALKLAEDLGVDKEVQSLKSDISYLRILKNRAGEAMSLVEKVRKQKA